MGQILDDGSGSAQDLETKIKEKIYCELQKAVSDVNQTNFYTYDNNGKRTPYKPLPEKWGVLMTTQLTVDENTTFSPGVSLTDPIAPVKVFGSPTAQSFSMGIGGSVSADATRTDKSTDYYLISDLDGKQRIVTRLLLRN
jgi:hypothetical protein